MTQFDKLFVSQFVTMSLSMIQSLIVIHTMGDTVSETHIMVHNMDNDTIIQSVIIVYSIIPLVSFSIDIWYNTVDDRLDQKLLTKGIVIKIIKFYDNTSDCDVTYTYYQGYRSSIYAYDV